MIYPSELDRAWVAGLFDGEGCIFVARAKHDQMRYGLHYRVTASLSLTHLPTLERLQSFFGGKIYYNKTASKIPGRKPIWNWVLMGAGPVHSFLRSILPFSHVKLAEIGLGLDACENWESGKNSGRRPLSLETLAIREGYYAALQQAKKVA